MKSQREGVLRVAAVAAGIVTWLDLVVRVLLPALGSAHFPTSAYWVAPRLVLDGRGPLLYDAVAFPAAAEQLGAFRDGWISNPPFNVLPLLPFGMLPEQPAYAIWTAASLVALLAAVVLMVRMLHLPTTGAIVLLAAVPLFHPLRVNLAVGQIYAFVLLLVVVSVVAFRRSAIAAGVALAATTIAKAYFGVVVLAVAIVQRRWRAAAVAIGLVAVAALVATPLVGTGAWPAFVAYGGELRSAPQTSVTAFQTLNSLFGHLFRHDATWNPVPAAHAPLLADLLWLASAAAITLVTAAVVARQRDPVLAVAVAIPAALLVAPVAEDAHYAVVVFSVAVAAVGVGRRGSRPLWPAALLIGAIALLGPAWPFNRPGVEGWSSLLFYPRVYGALLLWLLLVWLARRPRAPDGVVG